MVRATGQLSHIITRDKSIEFDAHRAMLADSSMAESKLTIFALSTGERMPVGS